MAKNYKKALEKEQLKHDLRVSKDLEESEEDKFKADDSKQIKVSSSKNTKKEGNDAGMIKKIQTLEKSKNGKVNSENKSGNIIDIEGLNKYYTNGYVYTHALKNINLGVKQGEIIVLLGQSGSGKTTLLNMMSGLDIVTEGTVVVANKAVHNMKNKQLIKFRREHTGFVFQSYSLMPDLKAWENVAIGTYLQSDKSKKIDAFEILKEVGMGEHANKFPRELSGGQQQRVSICRAIAKNPDILFADEPTAALDETSGREVLRVLEDINKKKNTTIIMVTHNQEIAKMADKVLHVKNASIEKITENKTRVSSDQIRW